MASQGMCWTRWRRNTCRRVFQPGPTCCSTGTVVVRCPRCGRPPEAHALVLQEAAPRIAGQKAWRLPPAPSIRGRAARPPARRGRVENEPARLRLTRPWRHNRPHDTPHGGRTRSSPPGKLPPHVQQAWPVPLVASDDMHGVAIGCPPEIDPQVPCRPWRDLAAAFKATPRHAEVEEPYGNLSNEEPSHLTTTSSANIVSGLSTARPVPPAVIIATQRTRGRTPPEGRTRLDPARRQLE